ncbi:MAG: NfeD family protein [Candidatus Aquicultorales bacterium]
MIEWLVKLSTDTIKAFFTEQTLPVWVKWLMFSGTFLFIELAHRAWILLWFGLGAAAAALVAFFMPQAAEAQVSAFFLVSSVSLVFGRSLVKNIFFRDAQHHESNVHGIIGRQATCLEEIDNLTGNGAVKLFGTEWKARGSDDLVRIAPGRQVKVVAVDQLTLVVAPVTLAETEPAVHAEPRGTPSMSGGVSHEEKE